MLKVITLRRLPIALLLLMTLGLAVPSRSQVEIAMKKGGSITSGKSVRFLPLVLIHKDPTFFNSPTKKGEVPQTLLMIEPYNARFRSGASGKGVAINVRGEVTEGPSVETTAFLTATDADLLLTRLYDARRVIKRWEALKDAIPEAERERVVVFNPHSDVQLRVELAKDGTLVWAVKVKQITSIGFIPDLSKLISQIEMTNQWLKTGKLPKF